MLAYIKTPTLIKETHLCQVCLLSTGRKYDGTFAEAALVLLDVFWLGSKLHGAHHWSDLSRTSTFTLLVHLDHV